MVGKVLLAKIKGNFITCIKHDPGMGDTDGQSGSLGFLSDSVISRQAPISTTSEQDREKSLGA